MKVRNSLVIVFAMVYVSHMYPMMIRVINDIQRVPQKKLQIMRYLCKTSNHTHKESHWDKRDRINAQIQSGHITNVETKDLHEIVEYLDIWACTEKTDIGKQCWNPYCRNNLIADTINGISEKDAQKARDEYLQAEEEEPRTDYKKYAQCDLDTLQRIESEVDRRMSDRSIADGMAIKEIRQLSVLENSIKKKKRCINNRIQTLAILDCQNKNEQLAELYEEVKKLGSANCSQAFETKEKCNNQFCCRSFYFNPKGIMHKSQEDAQKQKEEMLNKMDVTWGRRSVMMQELCNFLKQLDPLHEKAFELYSSGADAKKYRKIHDLLEFKENCTFAQLFLLEEGNYALWDECRKFASEELEKDETKRNRLQDCADIFQRDSAGVLMLGRLGDKIERYNKEIESNKEIERILANKKKAQE